MATVKVTITLPEEQLARIREIVAAMDAASVSGFVQHAVAQALDESAAWRAELDAAIEASRGPMTDADREWAMEILTRGQPHLQ